MSRRPGLRHLALLAPLWLGACGGSLPPPDWKMNAQSALEAHAKFYLGGDTALAELNFAKARAAIAHSGRLDLIARAELARCASHTAALDFDDCPGFKALAAEAAPAETAYAEFLAGRWQTLDRSALPKHYSDLLGAGEAAARSQALAGIKEPQARLIAAASLFKQGELNPAGIELAIDTASERGWRRPLLAWLRVGLSHAEGVGDTASMARYRKRIELVLASQPGAP